MATQPIALVLAGGGARGAYEAGVLSVLLPALPDGPAPEPDRRRERRRDQRRLPRRDAARRRRPRAGAGPRDLGGDPLGRRAGLAVAARPRPARPRRADLHRPALARTCPRCWTPRRCRRRWSALIPFERIAEHVAAGPPDGRRGRRHLRAHRPQRRLPLRRHARRGPRRQARHRLRPDRCSTSSTCAPPRRSRPRSPPSRSRTARPPAGTSTAARA